ncbi:MAG: DUF1540 domain-containing protein [Clostridia bacterium]|nr:DUF1540 domain-containing protein [Clostridia bacterium]MDR3644216.1 DUF1540 domain-containing protein [Clostridia bacterium]
MSLKDKLGENVNKVTDKMTNHDFIDGIHCEVTNCAYHDPKCKCGADKINVGPTFASSSTDTVCSTFKQK